MSHEMTIPSAIAPIATGSIAVEEYYGGLLMSRIGIFIVMVLVTRPSFAQDVQTSVTITERRAAEQIENSNISRADAVKITATFMETQAARNALKKALQDYVDSIDRLDASNASRLTRLLAESEGQLRIMHCANALSKALDKVDLLANQFNLIAPDAARLANNYQLRQKAPVVDQAKRPNLVPPTKEEAAKLLHTMQGNDSAFEAAYSAFCGRMETKFGFTFIAEATQVALKAA